MRKILYFIDYDEEFEVISDEIEFDHAESQDDEEYATIIGPTVVAEFAEKINVNIEQLIEILAEQEFDYLERNEIREMLLILHKWSSMSVSRSQYLVIHSYE